MNKQIDTLRESLSQFEAENSKLHELVTEDEQIRQENIKMSGEIAYIKENEEVLQKLNDYYRDDLVPNI